MKTVVLAMLLTATTASADVIVAENHQKLTIDCARDGAVSLLGNHIAATLIGPCTHVQVAGNHIKVTGSAAAVGVAGNHNTLTLDAVDELTVLGNSNAVSFKRGLTTKSPRVANAGNKNRIGQAP